MLPWINYEDNFCFFYLPTFRFLFTGLTCGMFTRDGVKVACADSTSGLYIKARNNEIVKVIFLFIVFYLI